jgi:hypothetical protein
MPVRCNPAIYFSAKQAPSSASATRTPPTFASPRYHQMLRVTQSCAGFAPGTAATPVARLDAANNRLQALVQAAKTVRPRLAAFYASLDDEQKAQFNNLGQQSSTRSENAPGNR